MPLIMFSFQVQYHYVGLSTSFFARWYDGEVHSRKKRTCFAPVDDIPKELEAAENGSLRCLTLADISYWETP